MPLARALGLEPGDMRSIAGVLGVHALIGAAIAAGDASVQSVFLARMGASGLPIVLLAKAVLNAAAAFAYTRFARRRSVRAVLAALLVASAVVSLASRGAMTHGAIGALAAYAVHEVVSTIVQVHWGVYLLSHVSGDRALRTFPLVYAAARGGAAAAGAACSALAPAAGAPSGMFLAVALFVVAALLARRPQSAPGGAPAPDSRPPPPRDGRPSAAPWSALLRTRLLPAIAASTVLLVFVRFALRLQQQSILDGLPEAELARILGLYLVVANILGVVLQVLFGGRLLARAGLTTMNVLYATAALAAQIALIVRAGVPTALSARFADDELKDSVKTPVSNLFYEAFDAEARGRARAMVLGVVSPAAHVVGALVLAALVGARSETATAITGVVCGCVFVVTSIYQNRSYRRACGSLAADA